MAKNKPPSFKVLEDWGGGEEKFFSKSFLLLISIH